MISMIFSGSHNVILGFRDGDKSDGRFHSSGLFMVKVLT